MITLDFIRVRRSGAEVVIFSFDAPAVPRQGDRIKIYNQKTTRERCFVVMSVVWTFVDPGDDIQNIRDSVEVVVRPI